MRWLPLLPPWLVGTWVMATFNEIWDPGSLGPNINGDSLAAGWMLLGTLVVTTILYAGAPTFGRKLAVSTNNPMLAGLGHPNGLQESFGATVVRGFSLLTSYVIVAAMAFN